MVYDNQKLKNSLSSQIDKIITTRRMSALSNESEMNVTQLKNKIYKLKSKLINTSTSASKKTTSKLKTQPTSSLTKKTISSSTNKPISKLDNGPTSSTVNPLSNLDFAPLSSLIEKKRNFDEGPSTSSKYNQSQSLKTKVKLNLEIEDDEMDECEEPKEVEDVENGEDMAEVEMVQEVAKVEDAVELLIGAPNNHGIECDQLYGRNFNGDTMINIGNEIYCKATVLDMTMGSSHKATHIARKLLEGVFNREALLNSTISGLPARAQGRERQNVKVNMLNLRARNVIIEFSKILADKKGWIISSTEQIERAMSQRIGEIKRSAN